MPSSFNRFNNRRRSRISANANLSFESLERRELMAADFASNLSLFNVAKETSLTQETVATTSQSSTDSTPSTNQSSSTNIFGDVALIPDLSLVDVPPALDATLNNGTLTITGSNDDDNILVYAQDGTLHVREVTKELDLLTTPVSNVTSIVVNAHQGDDWINIDHHSIDIGATIRGGSGDDQLLGGSGNDTITGDSGNDELVGRGGDDTLKGNDGDDLLVGGDGNDRLYGGDGDDYLVGGKGNDLLKGEAGNDNLFAEAGDDTLYGGNGNNLLDGGDGNDRIFGGSGIDAVYAGAGDDYIRTFDGDDRIRGEQGDDNITGDNGNDYIVGGDGDDVIQGLQGNDLISGCAGNDYLMGGAGQDWLDGAEGNDRLQGLGDDDWLQGGEGRDTLDGGAGSDQVYQDFAKSEIGSIAQASLLGKITDFAGDVWDGITTAFEWSWDKAESLGRSLFTWAISIDDRVVRFGEDIAAAFTNWPWHADFWKNMGRAFVDSLETAGLAEAWQFFFEINKPWQRGLNDREMDVARSVFGDEINLDQVRIDEFSLITLVTSTVRPVEAQTSGYIINSVGDINDETMIHELVHVWQFEESGLNYIPEALAAQNSDEKYDYGGVAGLRAAKDAGQGFESFNREQQGDIVKNYFHKREDAKTGRFISQAEHDVLDLYIHFVQEVSSLSPEELDVTDGLVSSSGSTGKLALVPNDAKSRDNSTLIDQPAVRRGREDFRAKARGEWGNVSKPGTFWSSGDEWSHQATFSELGSFDIGSLDYFAEPTASQTQQQWVLSRIASDGEDELPVATNAPEGEDELPVLSGFGIDGEDELPMASYAGEGEDEQPVLNWFGTDGKDELPMARYAGEGEDEQPVLSGFGTYGKDDLSVASYAGDGEAKMVAAIDAFFGNSNFDRYLG